jgi:molybdopterin converting factor small subunit
VGDNRRYAGYRNLYRRLRKKTMRVTVKFFTYYRSIAGTDRLTVDISDDANVAELVEKLRSQFDSPSFTLERAMPLVNKKRAIPETVLKEGDEVLLLHLMSGG